MVDKEKRMQELNKLYSEQTKYGREIAKLRRRVKELKAFLMRNDKADQIAIHPEIVSAQKSISGYESMISELNLQMRDAFEIGWKPPESLAQERKRLKAIEEENDTARRTGYGRVPKELA